MAIALVQRRAVSGENTGTALTLTLGSLPTLGNLLVGAWAGRGSPYDDATSWPAGWIKQSPVLGLQTPNFNGGYIVLAARLVTDAAAQQSTVISGHGNYRRACIAEFSGIAGLTFAVTTGYEENTPDSTHTTRSTPSISPPPGRETLIIGAACQNRGSNNTTTSDLTRIDWGQCGSSGFVETGGGGSFGPAYCFGYRVETLLAGSHVATFTASAASGWGDIIAAFSSAVGFAQVMVV